MVNKKSLATFVRTVGNQVIAGFKHFLNNVKIGGDLIISPDSLGNPATNVLTVDGNGVVKTATAFSGISVDSVSKVKHEVKAGVAINKGQAVYVTGADGTNMIVGLASNATEATSSKTMGLLESTVAINGKTNVITEGLLSGLDTSMASAGDVVWLGTGGNLLYGLANKPYAPAHLVFIGIVTRSNSNNGEIFVKVQNGFELNEIHDVDLKTTVPVNGHILGFDGTLWVNKTIAGWLGYTPANAANESNWNAAYNDKINSAAVTGTTTKTLTLTQQDGGTITASWTDINTDAVTSVFGRTGAVVATSGDYTTAQVTESGNLYFTNARGIGSTLTGYASGAGVISSADTILSAIQKLNGNIGALVTGVSSVNGLSGAVTLTTTNIAEGTNLYYTEARVNANTNVAANTAARHNAVTIGTANGLSLSTQVLSLGLASASTTGALSSTDWTTFNSKQNALTNPVTGTGTTNYVSKFTGTNTVGNSQIFDNGTNVGIGTATPDSKLHISTTSSNPFRMVRTGGAATNFGYEFGNGAIGLYDYTNSSYRYYITSGGNVGIGTTAPAQKLDISQGSIFLSGSGSKYLYIRRYDGLGTHSFGVGSDEKLILSLSGSNPFIVNGGNVGIGTTTPAQPLVVSNGGAAGFEWVPSTGRWYRYNRSTSAYAGIYTEASEHTWSIGASEAMRINASGNVGIGTTSPGAKLNVSGGFIRVEGTSTDQYFLEGVRTGVSTTLRIYDNSSVPFYDSYGSMYFRANQNGGSGGIIGLFGGNVGIGTTSPGSKLEVYDATNPKIYISGGGLSSKAFVSGYAGNFDIGTEGSNPVTFYTNAIERVRIMPTGSVGIGTTSPATILDVNGTISVAGYPVISNSGNYNRIHRPSGTVGIYLGNATDAGNYYDNSTHYFRSSGGGTTYAVISAAGNVGIGTTSPSALLHVAKSQTSDTAIMVSNLGTVGASTTLSFVLAESTTPQGWFRRYRDGSANTEIGFSNSLLFTGSVTGTKAERMRITDAGNVGIGTTSPTQKLDVVGTGATNVRIASDSTAETSLHFGNTTGGRVSVRSNAYLALDTNATERMRIDASGNVGIGTTTPAHKLSVVGSGTGIAHIGDAGFGSGNYVGASFNGTLSTTNYNILSSPTNPHLYLNRPAGKEIKFREDNTEQMTILSGGNVGIGTTLPAQKLHVNSGNIRIDGGSYNLIVDHGANSGGVGVVLQSTGSNLPFLRWTDGTNINAGIRSNSSSSLIFQTNGFNDRLTINSSGNVGIGTTSPNITGQAGSGTLTVKNSSTYGVVEIAGSSATQGGVLSFFGNTTRFAQLAGEYSSANNGMMIFRTLVSGTITENIRIVNGNVGIGTTSPAQKLDVAGTVRTTGTLGSSSGSYSIDHQGVNTWKIGITATNTSTFHIGNDTGGAFVNKILNITSAGNVGIGTTSPGAKLEIAGTASTLALSFGNSVPNNPLFINTYGGFTGIGMDQTTAGLRLVGDFGGNNLVDIGYYSSNVVAHANWISRMCVLGNGNVGIGTTSPASVSNYIAQTINGTDGSFTEYRQNGTALFRIGADSSRPFLYGMTNAPMDFYTNTNFAMRITAGGNVGIGTTSPLAILDVYQSGQPQLRVRGTTGANHLYQDSTTGTTINDGLFVGIGGDQTGYIWHYEANPLIFATGNSERIRITSGGNVGIGTTSPSAKLHVIGNATVSATLSTANAKISGTLADSFNQVGTAGQVLSSTGTGIEWVTGGGGGGTTITVKDEGTTVGSSFTTLDFYGSNIQAGASGSTAVITALNNAGTGSVYSNDTTAQYAPTASFANVEINTVTVEATAPDTAGTGQKLIATITFGVDNVSDVDGFNNFDFRLYNSSASSAIADTTHSWCSYMSKGEFEKRTVFTFHIPLYDGVGGSDTIIVQAKQSTAYTPEIYYCALTFIKGTN